MALTANNSCDDLPGGYRYIPSRSVSTGYSGARELPGGYRFIPTEPALNKKQAWLRSEYIPSDRHKCNVVEEKLPGGYRVVTNKKACVARSTDDLPGGYRCR